MREPLLFNVPGWWDDALCANYDAGANRQDFLDMWFSQGQPADATDMCRACPVAAECLTAAMEEEAGSDERFGIRGGHTPSQRRRLANNGNAPPPPPVDDHPIESWPCALCSTATAARDVYDNLPAARRANYRRSEGRGLCDSCWGDAHAGGFLDKYPRRTVRATDVLDWWVALRDKGVDVPAAAVELTMTKKALYRTLAKARRQGDPRGNLAEVAA